MKKTIKLFIAGAFALMPIVACQKEEVAFTSTDGLSFTSTKPILEDETKTAWNGTSIQWSKGDAIRVAYTCDGVWQNADGTATAESKNAKMYQSTALSADAETAQFSVPGDFKGTAEGSYVFYGAYPASICTDGPDFSNAPSLTVTIPSAQTPAADSFDSAADFMLGTSANTYTGIPTEVVSMSWDRMVAHAQLTFKTLNGFTAGETISKVELTADSEADMVGKHVIDLDTKSITKPNSTVANALTINGTNLSVDETGTFVAWASFLPCTVKSLTVVVTTDKATYTREIASCELVFKKNARNVLAVNMSSAIREASLLFEETFNAITGGNSTTANGSSAKVIAAQMANFSNYADATYQAGGAVRIGKSGSLVTKNLDLSKNFYVVVTAKGWSSSEMNLTVSAGEQSETVTLETYMGGVYKEYTIYFNAVSSSSTVKFTTGSTRCFIDNIRIEEGSDPREPLTTPSVRASANSTTPNSIDVAWDAVKNAGSYVVTATTANGSAVSSTVTADAETTTYKYTITGLAYKTAYTISVVAKPSDTSLYLDSAAGEAKPVTTGANPGGEVTIGDSWTSKSFYNMGENFTTGNNSIDLADTGQTSLLWSISKGATTGTVAAGTTDKGVQLQKNAGILLTTTNYSGGVSKIILNMSKSSKGPTFPTVTITVDGKSFTTTSTSFTTSAAEYEFTCTEGVIDATGKTISIMVKSSASSSYVKYVKINPAN